MPKAPPNFPYKVCTRIRIKTEITKMFRKTVLFSCYNKYSFIWPEEKYRKYMTTFMYSLRHCEKFTGFLLRFLTNTGIDIVFNKFAFSSLRWEKKGHIS